MKAAIAIKSGTRRRQKTALNFAVKTGSHMSQASYPQEFKTLPQGGKL